MASRQKPTRYLWIYVFLIVAVMLALVCFAAIGIFSPSDFAKAIFPLLGTFVGAFLAFRLQEYREEIKDEKTRKASLNRALLVLGVQHNEIRSYLKLIAPYKDEIEIAFNFPGIQPQEKFEVSQKIDDLNFLLESGYPNLLFEIIIEQGRFDQTMEAIRIRNIFYVRELQPVLAAKKLNKKSLSRMDLETEVGEYLFGSAVNGANSMASHIRSSNESLPALFENLRKISKQLYPAEKFVEFDLLPLGDEDKPSTAS